MSHDLRIVNLCTLVWVVALRIILIKTYSTLRRTSSSVYILFVGTHPTSMIGIVVFVKVRSAALWIIACIH